MINLHVAVKHLPQMVMLHIAVQAPLGRQEFVVANSLGDVGASLKESLIRV
jgi:hypothetical protein